MKALSSIKSQAWRVEENTLDWRYKLVVVKPIPKLISHQKAIIIQANKN